MTQRDRMELELDTRLATIWALIDADDHTNLPIVASLLRLAYGQGHADALTEDEPLSLYKSLGYKVPG